MYNHINGIIVNSIHNRCNQIFYSFRLINYSLVYYKIRHEAKAAYSQNIIMQHLYSIYPASIQHLSIIYPASIHQDNINRIYPASIQYLSSIYPASIQHLSSIYPASIHHLSSIYPASV